MSEESDLIKERFKKLPKDIQEAITSSGLSEKFKTMINKHGLRIDQGLALENETMFVMLGFESPDDFVDNVRYEVKVPRDEAKIIAEEINRIIFLPIKSSLKNIRSENVLVENKSVDDTVAKQPAPNGQINHSLLSTTKKDTTKPEPAAFSEKESMPQKDIFREKLEGPTRSAKENVAIGETPTPLKLPSALLKKADEIKSDPYKETVEKEDFVGIKQEAQVSKDDKPQKEIFQPVTPNIAPKLENDKKQNQIPTKAVVEKTITQTQISPSPDSTKEASTKLGVENTQEKKETPTIVIPTKPIAEEKKKEEPPALPNTPPKQSVGVEKTPVFTEKKEASDKKALSFETKNIAGTPSGENGDNGGKTTKPAPPQQKPPEKYDTDPYKEPIN